MLLSASLLIVLRLITAFARQRRSGAKPLRLAAALVLLGVLVWCACQKYLFVTSVFPVLSLWLGGAVLALSIALLLSGALPYTQKKEG